MRRVLSAQDCPVRLAARSTDSAEALRRSGLRVSGIGGEVRADAIEVAAIEDYGKGDQFDLILLATKAQDALMLIIEDQHEHLGQSIAYARSNGVVPPWSK